MAISTEFVNGFDFGHGVAAMLEVVALTTVDVEHVIENLLTTENEDADSACSECSNCGEPLGTRADECGNCGAARDDDASSDEDFLDQGTLDDDEPRQEAEDKEKWEEWDRAVPDRVEQLVWVLQGLGWTAEVAEQGARVLARVLDKWPCGAPADYDKALNVSKAPTDLLVRLREQAVRNAMIAWCAERRRTETNGPVRVRAEISILKDAMGNWCIEVSDRLECLKAVPGTEKVRIGQFIMSITQFKELLRMRQRNLEALAKALLEDRADFFNAANCATADQVLATQPLQQKDVAAKVSIAVNNGQVRKSFEKTLSGWCNAQRPVWIITPHGTYRLRDLFLKRSTRAGATTEEVINLCRQAIKEWEKEKGPAIAKQNWKKGVVKHVQARLKESGHTYENRQIRDYLETVKTTHQSG